jgi:hypothetical protein
VDADWGGDVDTRCSTSGFILWVGDMPIVWKSKLQSVVSLSSTEAEYVAACACAREVVWLRNLLTQVGQIQSEPTVVFEDNAGCIFIANNVSSSVRTKHLDINYHYVREKVTSRELTLVKIATQDNVADMLTKPLDRVLFSRHAAACVHDISMLDFSCCSEAGTRGAVTGKEDEAKVGE